MSELAGIIFFLLFMLLIAWAVSNDDTDRDRCKDLGRVVVHYEHKNYCANLGDLK
jgi:hypothetical protein